jgi:S-DNA-T family DNA segregation ATPase FtsK/SpoIIIE
MLVETMKKAAEEADIPPARSPWQPALPAFLALTALTASAAPAQAGAGTDTLTIGLADLPEQLAQVPLTLTPDEGNLLIVGSRRSGRTTAAHTIAAASLARGWEVHAISANAEAFADLDGHPGFGTLIGPSQVRLVQRLCHLLAEGTGAGGSAARRRVLIVDDAEALAAFSLPGAVDHPIDTLNATAGSSGLWIVATCLARQAAARWTGHFPVRLALPTTDRTEDLAAGVPTNLAGTRTTPGRVAILRPGVEALGHIAVAIGADAQILAPATAPPTRPLRLRPVPETVGEMPAPRPGWVWLGRGGDFAEPLGLAIKPGHRLGIVGPPGSGRTSLLRLIEAQVEATGERPAVWVEGSDPACWALAYQALAEGAAVLIDNAEDAGPHPGEPPGSGILMMSVATRAANGFGGAGALLRTRPTGVILWSSVPGSAEVFGLRAAEVADPAARLRPGRGILVTGQSTAPIQCAQGADQHLSKVLAHSSN